MTQEFEERIIRLSQGNPGALNVVINLIQNYKDTSSLMALKILDENEIYGPNLYVLANDHCEQDMIKFKKLVIAAHAGEVLGTLKTLNLSRLKELSEERYPPSPGLTDEERKLIWTA